MKTSDEISLVLADDHAIVREGIAALCAANGLRIAGQCADGPAAYDMINRLKPDFAILDLQMPGMSGVETIRRLRASGCSAKLMVLSISRDQGIVHDALLAGADAYLLKDGPVRHLLDAISYVREGGVWVSPLLGGAALYAKGGTSKSDDPLSCLSPRELEVFQFLVDGLRAKDIADRLEISPKTVDTYRASLMRKLNVPDLVSLVKFAIERNLTTTSPKPPGNDREPN
jgi:DNA-binding NarL/FixJ family response regulator